MTTTTPITTIGSGKRIEFSARKMPAAGAAMPASAKDPYLVNKICFLHFEYCGGKSNGSWIGDSSLRGRQPSDNL